MPTTYPDLTSIPKRDHSNPDILPLIFKYADQITHDYNTNREAYFKNVKTPLDNVVVDTKDASILNDAKSRTNKAMKPILEDNAFHKASEAIFKIQHDLTGDALLKQAQLDKVAIEARNKQWDESKWTPEQKTYGKLQDKLSYTTVSMGEDGLAKTGANVGVFQDGLDNKELKELLSSFDNKADYGVNSTKSERMMSNDAMVIALTGKSISTIMDENGVMPAYGTSTTSVKELTGERVQGLIMHELAKNKTYQSYITKSADLELFKQRYNNTTALKGSAPKSKAELVKFTAADAVSHLQASENEKLRMYTLAKTEGVDVLTDKKVDMAKLTAYAANKYSNLSDVDSYYSQVYANDYVMGDMTGTANGIASKIAYKESDSSFTFTSNPMYTTKTKGGDGTDDDNSYRGLGVSEATAVSGTGAKADKRIADINESMKRNTLELNKAVQSVAATRSEVYAKTFEGLTTDDINSLETAIQSGKLDDAKTNWTNTTMTFDEAVAKHRRIVNEDGNFKREAFKTDGEYNRYSQQQDSKDLTANTLANLKMEKDNMFAANKDAIVASVDNYLDPSTGGFETNINTNVFIDTFKREFGQEEFDKAMNAGRMRRHTNRGDAPSIHFNTRWDKASDLKKFIAESDDPDKYNTRLKKALIANWDALLETGDVLDKYSNKTGITPDVNLTYKIAMNPPKAMSKEMRAQVNANEGITVVSASSETLEGSGWRSIMRVPSTVDSDKIAINSKNAPVDNVTIIPVYMSDGTHGVKIVNNNTEQWVLLGLAATPDKINQWNMDYRIEGLKSNNKDVALRSVAPGIENGNRDIPAMVGETYTNSQGVNDHLRFIDAGDYEVTTVIPVTNGTDNQMPVKFDIVKYADGQISVNAKAAINYEDPNMQAEYNAILDRYNSETFNKQVYNSDGSVTISPVRYNDYMDALTMTIFEHVWNGKQR